MRGLLKTTIERERGFSLIIMAINMMENIKMTNYMALVFILGHMEMFTLANLKMITIMVKAKWYLKMVAFMRESTKRVK